MMNIVLFSRGLRERVSQHKSVFFASYILLLVSLTILQLVALEHSRALVLFPGEI
jgi:hypothetical protein